MRFIDDYAFELRRVEAFETLTGTTSLITSSQSRYTCNNHIRSPQISQEFTLFQLNSLEMKRAKYAELGDFKWKKSAMINYQLRIEFSNLFAGLKEEFFTMRQN